MKKEDQILKAAQVITPLEVVEVEVGVVEVVEEVKVFSLVTVFNYCHKYHLGYSNSDRSAVGHGGEKSSGKFTAPSAEPWDSCAADPVTIANTDDWGNTAVKALDEDWNSASIEQDLSKLSFTKKGFTIVKVVIFYFSSFNN